MKENTFYFSHDYNAQNDPKMTELLSECGLSGVGFYWILIEQLHQQTNGKITLKQFKSYLRFYTSFDHSGSNLLDTIEATLFSTGLLKMDGDLVFSARVIEHKKDRAELSKIRSYAGKQSALKREKSTSVEQVSTSVQHYKGKESKGKESKGVGVVNDFNYKKEKEKKEKIFQMKNQIAKKMTMPERKDGYDDTFSK